MMTQRDSLSEVSRILARARGGDTDAFEDLVPIVYSELEGVASRQLGRERVGHSLQPGDLVNEAWMKLTAARERGFENRAHFFGVVALAKSQILVDHAWNRDVQKRKAPGKRITLS